MLGSNKKIPNDNYFIFYNNPKSPDGAVESTGDDTTGGNSDGGDDETLNVDLQKVDPSIQNDKFALLAYRNKGTIPEEWLHNNCQKDFVEPSSHRHCLTILRFGEFVV